MPALRSVGPSTTATSLARRVDVDSGLTGMITQSDMQSRVDTAVAPYALKTYVDQQDGNFTTKAYVDQQDALYVPNSWRGAANGVAELSSGAMPASRFPDVPILPCMFARSWYNTDFTDVADNGTIGEQDILNSTIQVPTNLPNQYYRWMIFGNFEAWSTNYNSTTGKPVIKVYINGYLQGYGAGRHANGNVSGTGNPAGSCPIPVTSVGDDLGHVPGHGWNNGNPTVRVTLSSGVSGGAVTYNPTVQTLLTIIVVPSSG